MPKIHEIVTEAQVAALTAAGYAIVPRRPTAAMMDAGLYQASHDATWEDVYSSWVDMVDAAVAAQ